MNIRQIIRDELIKVLNEGGLPQDKHQERISVDTVKNPRKASMLGTLTFPEAVMYLVSIGYPYTKIKSLNRDIQFGAYNGKDFFIYPNTRDYTGDARGRSELVGTEIARTPEGFYNMMYFEYADLNKFSKIY